MHKSDFVGNRWLLPILLLGNNKDTSGIKCFPCYPHSDYYAEVPEQYQKDQNGQYIMQNGDKVETEEWGRYTDKWGMPKKIEGEPVKYINHAIPQLVKPNKPNGERYDENPF